MSKIYQKTKDVYIQRRNTNNNGFDEYPLSVIPDGIVTTDEASNLVMQRLTDLTFASASFAYRSRYAEFCISSSWASASLNSLNSISASWAPTTTPTATISSSWASSSISSSYSITASFATSASYEIITETFAVIANSASWASSSISSSYALVTNRIYTEQAVIAGDMYPALFTANGPSNELIWNTNTVKINPANGILTAIEISASIISASFVHTTASWAVSASWAPMPTVSNSSSWASSSISSSYALTASFALNGGGGSSLGTGSTYPFTSSWASSSISASYALTASFALNGGSSLSGLDNYVPVWSSNQLTATSSIYQTSGNVGIGLTFPTAFLHITSSNTTSASTAPLKLSSGQTMSLAEAGAIEFVNNDYYATITTIDTPPVGYVSQYPPTFDTASVLDSHNNTAWQATQPTGSLIGDPTGVSFLAIGVYQRINIDLGSAKTIVRIYYENYHISGAVTGRGIKDISIWGSNSSSSFLDTNSTHDSGWTGIQSSSLDIHVSANTPDPKYLSVNNSSSYRYYSIKSTSNWGDPYTLTGIRRIEFQTGLYNQGSRKGVILNDGTSLTSGRVPYATTNGRLTDSALLTFDGATLNATASKSITSSFASVASSATSASYATTSSYASNAATASSLYIPSGSGAWRTYISSSGDLVFIFS